MIFKLVSKIGKTKLQLFIYILHTLNHIQLLFACILVRPVTLALSWMKISLKELCNLICVKPLLGTLARYGTILINRLRSGWVQAFVSTRLDHCNRLPQREIEKLQHVQNTAARIVTRSIRRKHITPILKELHWFPVQSRIKFKLGFIIFKAWNNLAPSYLQELLEIYQPSPYLRSASKICFKNEEQSRKFTDELRLETFVDNLKKKFKTFLFNQLLAAITLNYMIYKILFTNL